MLADTWSMVQSLYSEQNDRRKKETKKKLTTYRPVGYAAGKNYILVFQLKSQSLMKSFEKMILYNFEKVLFDHG